MHVFEEYISKIGNPELKQRTQAILQWVEDTFPQLEPRIAWNQPMFTDHGTFIIGFSVAKHHISVAPEAKGIDQFSADIVQAGYDHGKNLFRMKESLPVDYPLLKKIIEFNIEDKADCSTFWRK
ncbi:MULTISPECIES: iron chaperone [Bacillus]|uniref:iron chaperone n=1 Tax=Bacillus TaxID=1386 RepID=UPI0004259CC9|nr:iron chaperone [Bacillus safensis]MBU8603167.1 iron chaperone [Bacillus safensis]MBU8615408.1 iron chaperone [Bacillus safensis]MBU8626597.1 iron chaperone [Bacillus safensis]MBZ9519913.1 iron chaperone [Bacillus safensis]MCY1095676.1 iron chaperone [Bacillus safensis]